MLPTSTPTTAAPRSLRMARRAGALLALSACALSFAPPAHALAVEEASIADLQAAYRDGRASAHQVVAAYLARIAAYDKKGPYINSLITINPNALEEADALDARYRASGKFSGPLHGIPVVLKDNLDAVGMPMTSGFQGWKNYYPPSDAPLVAKIKAAGGIIIAKASLSEFAKGGGDNINSVLPGFARNPYNTAYATGGSSGGPAAALAANFAVVGVGTDTGGSVRMPASYCGIVGLKPTYGLVPIRGIMPLTLSLDHCGPMTRTVEDNALMLGVMAGYDNLDITSVEHAREDYLAQMGQPVKGLRLGMPAGYFDDLHPEVAKTTGEAIALLGKLAGGVKDCTLPSVTAFGNLGAMGETLAWHEDYFKKQPTKYMLPERRRLEGLAAANAKATDYIRAKWELESLRRTVDDSFSDFDLVVLPTQRILPPPLDELIKRAHDPKPTDPKVTSNTAPFDVFGLPAISIPCGFSKSGLPIGLMIAGPHFAEGKVLALARAYEQATQWHTRKPPLTPNTPKPPVVTG